MLVAVQPEGFVMIEEGGRTLHSAGLPWWLFDMRPQGYLGRAYVARYAPLLGLPQSLQEWNDVHALRALQIHGHDLVGNLLLGDLAREQFLGIRHEAIPAEGRAAVYARMAIDASAGGQPGSSAGGEQPKFTAYAATPSGYRHVLVKFSEREAGPVSERWRDLLLAEHLALRTLGEAGIAAAISRVLDHEGQRFLEVERFDRVGELGRRGLLSLAALDAEFLGSGSGNWPLLVRRLATDGHVDAAAAQETEVLWAFGTLIGNTDMHLGNLSFMNERGRPYQLAPAYDMTPMAFRPGSGGGLRDELPEASIHAQVSGASWRRAATLASEFLERLRAGQAFSARFMPCIAALENHLLSATRKINRIS